MINKIFPRKIDQSSDARIRKTTDMVDALNVSVTTDFDSSDGSGGNVGVLKPVKGNSEVEPRNVSSEFSSGDVIVTTEDGFTFPLQGLGGVTVQAEQRVLGSVTDDVLGVIFFFVWSNVLDEMGVYAYDRDGILPNSQADSYVKVFSTREFNFLSTGFVKGDVVHLGRPSFGYDKTVLLYFTDNNNEPRKLDVFRCMTTGQGFDEYDQEDLKDLITACPKTPLAPIDFYFANSPDRSVSNFTKVPGMQFAYQHIYKDNTESAISTYSLLAIPPTYTSSGVDIPSLIPENTCIIQVPESDRTKEIKSIRLLVRFGKAGVFKIIDEVLPEDSLEYKFFNDRVLIPVSASEQNKLFTNLPRRAQAQAIASDRLIYANYLDGYNDVDTSDVVVSASYKPLESSTVDAQIQFIPFIIQSEAHGAPAQFGRNRISGYRLQAAGFPSTIEEDTIITIEFNVSPSQNFHIYDQCQSFHGTSQSGSGTVTNADELNFDNSFTNGDYREGRSYFGGNSGVSYNGDPNSLPRWRFENPDGTEGNVRVAFGTSAANPLILKGPQSLQYSLEFKINQEIENGGNGFIAEAVAKILSGQDVDGIEILINNSVSDYTINLGLNSSVSDEIPVAYGDDDRKNLIVGVANIESSPSNPDSDPPPTILSGDVQDYAPCGYFIVNKAKVSVGFKNFTQSDIVTSGFSTGNFIGLDIKSLDPAPNTPSIDIRTCIPYFKRQGYSGKTPAGDYDENNTNPIFGDTYMFGVQDQDVDETPTSTGSYQWSTLTQIIGVGSSNAPDAIFENLSIHSWRVFSRSYLQSATASSWKKIPNNVSDDTVGGKLLFENVLWYEEDQVPSIFKFQHIANRGTGTNGLANSATYIRSGDYTYAGIEELVAKNTPNRLKCAGYLTNSNGGLDVNLLATSEEREALVEAIPGLDSNLLSCFSILDGEGVFQGTNNYLDITSTYGSINGAVVWAGHIRSWMCHREFLYTNLSAGAGSSVNTTFFPEVNLNSLDDCSYNEKRIIQAPLLDFLFHEELDQLTGNNLFPVGADGSNTTSSIFTQFNEFPEITNYSVSENLSSTPDLSYNEVNTGQLETFVEVGTVFSSAIVGGSPVDFRSFKTKANHEFGIVYYDERGRSGNVNYLDNLYVAGYNSEERGSNKGRVEVNIQLNHNPPSWAKQYQIVYAGNTTVEDFIQYSSGGAFTDVQGVATQDFDEEGSVIFVSLNYLQGSNGVSYTDGFGAVNPDGGKNMYVFSPGDKLRVVKYLTANGGSVYPKDYEFDIIGLKTFNASLADNPFYNSDSPAPGEDEQNLAHPSKVGEFLVLRNNPNATGFSFESVSAAAEEGAVDGSTNQHLWNNRTIIEIYSPKKSADADDRVYHEIGEVYNVVESEDNLIHEVNPVVVRRGDVFWRRVPVNTAPLSGGEFQNIMKFDGQTARFENVFLESSTFSDLFPATNVNDFGKPKIILPDAGEFNRRSSLTYSDKNNYNGRFNKFSSFNNSLLNFKDIPNEYGAINYIMNNYDSLFIIQENKCSILPVSRSIIATAEGIESLTTSNEVLGAQKFYAGDYGCDNNPESVVRAGTNIYFASKSAREVYKFNSNQGIQVISNLGVKKMFRNLFRDVMKEAIDEGKKVRVVGGYDPLNDEYILSVFAIEEANQPFEAEGVVGESATATIDLEQTIEDLQDQLEQQEQQITLLNNQIAEIESAESGPFILTPRRYDQIVNAGGQELDDLLGDPGFSAKVRLDQNNDGSVNVSDLLSLLTVFGSIIDNDNSNNPEVEVSTDGDDIIIG